MEAWKDFQAENGVYSIPRLDFVDAKHNHIPLGRIVHAIRRRRLFFVLPWVTHWKELMGHAWFALIPRHLDLKILYAVTAYKRKFNSLEIPHTFVIGADDEDFPEDCRGMKLGYTVCIMMLFGYHESVHEELRELGLLPREELVRYCVV